MLRPKIVSKKWIILRAYKMIFVYRLNEVKKKKKTDWNKFSLSLLCFLETIISNSTFELYMSTQRFQRYTTGDFNAWCSASHALNNRLNIFFLSLGLEFNIQYHHQKKIVEYEKMSSFKTFRLDRSDFETKY